MAWLIEWPQEDGVAVMVELCKEPALDCFPAKATAKPLFANPPTDSAEAKDAKRWRCFVKGLRSRFPGAGHGKRIKVVDICPMYGDEGKPVDNIAEFIDAAMSAESREGEKGNG